MLECLKLIAVENSIGRLTFIKLEVYKLYLEIIPAKVLTLLRLYLSKSFTVSIAH